MNTSNEQLIKVYKEGRTATHHYFENKPTKEYPKCPYDDLERLIAWYCGYYDGVNELKSDLTDEDILYVVKSNYEDHVPSESDWDYDAEYKLAF